MQNFQIYAVCICIAAIAYFYGRSRITSYVNAAQKRANSLPVYYGVFPALIALIMPALIIASWLITESIIMDMMLLNSLPASITQAEEFSGSVALAQIYNMAAGISVGDVPQWVTDAAAQFRVWKSQSNMMMTILAIGASLIGSFFALRRIDTRF